VQAFNAHVFYEIVAQNVESKSFGLLLVAARGEIRQRIPTDPATHASQRFPLRLLPVNVDFIEMPVDRLSE